MPALEIFSNVGSATSAEHLASASDAAAARLEDGYAADGGAGGPFSESSPPPGMAFSGYRKGCTGIVWRPASMAELSVQRRIDEHIAHVRTRVAELRQALQASATLRVTIAGEHGSSSLGRGAAVQQWARELGAVALAARREEARENFERRRLAAARGLR